MRLDVGHVDTWEIRGEEDTHPSSTVAVVEVTDLLELINTASEKGNCEGGGFSAAKFLLDLRTRLEEVEQWKQNKNLKSCKKSG